MADDSEVIAATRGWLDHVVIGLNLCPFAKSVVVKQQVRYVVSRARNDTWVLDDFERELAFLAAADPGVVDTTLLILPDVFAAFDDFISFLDLAEVTLRTHGLVGVLQVASFHPRYVFADLAEDDIANSTNRAPFPILHLLREASLDRAVAAFPDAASIYERNIATMRSMGPDGWLALQANFNQPAEEQH